MSPSQFMDALAKCASTAEINDSWRISVDEMALTHRDVASHLASLAWEATGYRFTYVGCNLTICFAIDRDLWLIDITLHSCKYSNATAGASSTQFTYECCQARGTTNNMAKQSAVSEEKQRAARRMDRFDCNGRMYITIHTGIATVKITHQKSHKKYVSIDLPEKWRTYIEHNYKLGPATVCRRSEAPLFQ